LETVPFPPFLVTIAAIVIRRRLSWHPPLSKSPIATVSWPTEGGGVATDRLRQSKKITSSTAAAVDFRRRRIQNLLLMFAVNNFIINRPPVRPPNGTRTGEKPHPSRGGNAYAPKVRDLVISMWENGANLDVPWLQQLRAQRLFPHRATCYRWIRQHLREGHPRRKRPTGNRISLREVHGQDLVNLAIYRMICPKAYIDEVRAYVHNRNQANPPYSQSQTVRAEHRLGLKRKAASTTSDCAYFEINVFKRRD